MNITETFGSLVFNDRVMRERLDKDTYHALKEAVASGKSLNAHLAEPVAKAMKDWAIEHGCTHFTHWFQPLTGITAEKHESFITSCPDGEVITDFSEKELVRGESDASSFPSGGLRETFEARGYTAWDPSSYAFIKENTLCIPTVFCSFSGESLDKKTPLLRSMEAVNTQALRILRLCGDKETKRVTACVGAEQEYFLISKELYEKREDLVLTGRTLFGAKPAKGQSLDYHYSGIIEPKVKAFMADLDEQLWKIGVLAKTEHNETAPSQHELAPVYATANTESDHNQLTMELMKKIADKHGFACLLHEKPFDYINGSGKHNNWSLSTDTGVGLFNPGKDPYNNTRFLLFFVAFIQAADQYHDLLKASVFTGSNDCRLGADEAPPSILSVYIGREMEEILETRLAHGIYGQKQRDLMKTGVDVIPTFAKDTEDRNRTSPIAFTGNKFEFRMPGASLSISGPNTMLNTTVAEVLRQFADELEQADDLPNAIDELINRTYEEHKRIIFNGNNYSKEWAEEAARRGLPAGKSTPEALPAMIAEKNIELFERHKIYTRTELTCRYEISMSTYQKSVIIEARTMVDMATRQIMPAVVRYADRLAQTALNKRAVLGTKALITEEKILKSINAYQQTLYTETERLKELINNRPQTTETEKADYARRKILPQMALVRKAADSLEQLTDAADWPLPTYEEMLFH